MGYVSLLMFIIFYIYAAVGSILFHGVNETLWGNISIAMLTLFRVATFEDWTDVMYETMAVYPLSWIYYLSFIFVIAFIFLNMMIGIVLETLQKEHDRMDLETGHRRGSARCTGFASTPRRWSSAWSASSAGFRGTSALPRDYATADKRSGDGCLGSRQGSAELTQGGPVTAP
jgi:hypothetical protein